MNKVFLIGRLTRDPELRYTSSNLPVATFTVAVNRNFANQAGEREADFINIVVWRKQAENVKNYLNQGADEQLYTDVKLTNIEDNVPLKYLGTKTFSSRAGIPEEAWRYSWYGTENKSRYANNLIRGAYTGFTGMENYKDKTEIMDIHTPGFNLANLRDYFLLRANSFHSFYSISNRYDVNLIDQRVNPYEELAYKANGQ